MKLKTFLRKLERTAGGWKVIRRASKDLIRLPFQNDELPFQNDDDVAMCPIAAVADNMYSEVISTNNFDISVMQGVSTGLSRKDSFAIIKAADQLKGYDKRLRKQLLKAVGLCATND